jgi:hypothetical protein
MKALDRFQHGPPGDARAFGFRARADRAERQIAPDATSAALASASDDRIASTNRIMKLLEAWPRIELGYADLQSAA